MNQFETNARKAEIEILKMLPPEDSIFRPWQLLNYSLENVTLKTTFDEIYLLNDKPAHLRPGYKVSDNKVYVPNFFIKLSGFSSTTSPEFFNQINKINDNKIIYDHINEFNRFQSQYITEKEISSILNSDGIIDKNKLFDSKIYRYNFLRLEYQNILIDKINLVIQNRNQLFSEIVQKDNITKIIFSLLNIDEKIIMLFQNFDFQDIIPCIVIHNENKELFNDNNAYTLALLNLLGFDIIFISSFGYADIENVINRNLLSIFNNSSKYKSSSNSNDKPEFGFLRFISALPKKVLIISLALILLVCFALVRFLFSPTIAVIIKNEAKSSAAIIINNSNDKDLENSNQLTIEENKLQEKDPQIELEQNPDQYTVTKDIPKENDLNQQLELDQNTNQNQNTYQLNVTEEKPLQKESTPQIEKPVNQVEKSTEPTGEGVIDISTVYPALRGTVEELDDPININTNIDGTVITKIDPKENLYEGIETIITFEVEYNLVSMDSAILDICLNTGGSHNETSENAMENTIWLVTKGKGKYRFKIPVVPKRWENGSPFWALAGFRKDSGVRICNTDKFNLSLHSPSNTIANPN